MANPEERFSFDGNIFVQICETGHILQKTVLLLKMSQILLNLAFLVF